MQIFCYISKFCLIFKDVKDVRNNWFYFNSIFLLLPSWSLTLRPYSQKCLSLHLRLGRRNLKFLLCPVQIIPFDPPVGYIANAQYGLALNHNLRCIKNSLLICLGEHFHSFHKVFDYFLRFFHWLTSFSSLSPSQKTRNQNISSQGRRAVQRVEFVAINMSHFSYACKMRCPLNLVLEKCEYLWFYLTFWIAILDCGLKLHKLSIHTLVMLQKWLEIY